MLRAMITGTHAQECNQMATSAKLMTADEMLLMRDDAPALNGFSIRGCDLFE